VNAETLASIEEVCEAGRAYWHRFDEEVRQDTWHPFVAADYDSVRDVLLSVHMPGRRFLEWGSATGVVTIMADLIGYDACGIELDPVLVESARTLATRVGSGARFAHGSFIPMGWVWKTRRGDARPGTIGDGPSGYLVLGRALSDFDVVYGFPWPGEEELMLELFRCHGNPEARLLLHSSTGTTTVHHRGRIEAGPAPAR
jgi:hypothetical protein